MAAPTHGMAMRVTTTGGIGDSRLPRVQGHNIERVTPGPADWGSTDRYVTQWRQGLSSEKRNGGAIAAINGKPHSTGRRILNKRSKRRPEGDPWVASSLLTIVHHAGIFLRGLGLQVLR